MDNNGLVENVYDEFSKVYNLVFGRAFHKIRRRALELLDAQPGHNVLEIGVGTGLVIPYYPKDIRLTGIDISHGMLKKAKKQAIKSTLPITLFKMDASRLSFKDNSFDRVLAFMVMSVLPDPIQALNEMIRVCKPTGKIIFTNHFQRERGLISIFEDLTSPMFRKIGFRTDLKLSELVRGAAIDIKHVEGFSFLDHWLAIVCNPLDRKSYHRKPFPLENFNSINQSIRRSGRLPKRINGKKKLKKIK